MFSAYNRFSAALRKWISNTQQNIVGTRDVKLARGKNESSELITMYVYPLGLFNGGFPFSAKYRAIDFSRSHSFGICALKLVK